MILSEYLDKYHYYNECLIEDMYVFIDNINGLCIEITDSKGTSVNINNYVDINLDTKINEIKEKILYYVVRNYLYTYC